MQKKIPMRQCMGCHERKAKKEMIRVVRTPEGVVCLDFSGKLGGRGAYVCPDAQCLTKCMKSKVLERKLETAIPQEVYERLTREVENGNG